jgi:23S rRNA (guanosine2251-2'-O)-methyltransferase
MRKLKTTELKRLSVGEFKSAEKWPVIIVLDNIRSQNNVGSIFRTADAFLCEAVFLCGITAVPPHREIHKTALGATESVEWRYFENTVDAIEVLRAKHYKSYAIEQVENSTSLEKFKPDLATGVAFIFGNEVSGIDDQVLQNVDGCIEIPQFGTKHSLNISVAAGIVIWDIFKKARINF